MPDKKRAQRISHVANKRLEDSSGRFERVFGSEAGDERLLNRILSGRRVKPCGMECEEFGLKIAKGFNHSSFENFSELMNDEDFLLEIAKITPNPKDCENYFYQYLNAYITKKSEFRLAFLKQIYLNDNVYKLEDVNWVVEKFNLNKENNQILSSIYFKKRIEKRLEAINYQDRVEFACSGIDKKELREYKKKENEMKILCENMKAGLKEILSTFDGEEQKKDEPKDYWEYLCSKSQDKYWHL